MAKEQKNKKYRSRKLKLDKLEDRVEKLSLDLDVFFDQAKEKLNDAQTTASGKPSK